MFYTYILCSVSTGRYYVGSCEDPDKRLLRHNNGGVPSTKPYRPWELVYKETFATRSEALKREREIKAAKSREYIKRLVELADTSRP